MVFKEIITKNKTTSLVSPKETEGKWNKRIINNVLKGKSIKTWKEIEINFLFYKRFFRVFLAKQYK
jgi:hypothetical protein